MPVTKKKRLRWCKCLDEVINLLSKQGAEPVMSVGWDGHCRAIVATQKVMGRVRDHKPLIHLVATFCPFCGKEYPPMPEKKG
jgi:hypothetical protein